MFTYTRRSVSTLLTRLVFFSYPSMKTKLKS